MASSRRSSRSAIADRDDGADGLAPLARLALAYAPARARADWLTVLLLDTRLAAVVRSAREPMLAQVRLAWWRDRLGEESSLWPRGEPLLARLRSWGDTAADLVALVDGWEALLGEPPLAGASLQAFADGRAAAIGALARRFEVAAEAPQALARRWALADLTLHLSDGAERSAAQALIGPNARVRIERSLRPLAVLAGLNLRAVQRGGVEPLDGPGALLAAIRLGMFSR
ncbi:hypothetical protein [Novosphingobium sp.]|uniref:hypothetical protein n=1 Tax=Novosphingobium sp. TaxID=1874826 RepID=UPI002606FB97|nr:hypothetical protein [Novosphingobium sp.]